MNGNEPNKLRFIQTQVGDQLIQVNGLQVSRATYDEVISLIKQSRGHDILLLVKFVGQIPHQENAGEPIEWLKVAPSLPAELQAQEVAQLGALRVEPFESSESCSESNSLGHYSSGSNLGPKSMESGPNGTKLDELTIGDSLPAENCSPHSSRHSLSLSCSPSSGSSSCASSLSSSPRLVLEHEHAQLEQRLLHKHQQLKLHKELRKSTCTTGSASSSTSGCSVSTRSGPSGGSEERRSLAVEGSLGSAEDGGTREARSKSGGKMQSKPEAGPEMGAEMATERQAEVQGEELVFREEELVFKEEELVFREEQQALEAEGLVLVEVAGGQRTREPFGCGVVKGPAEWPGVFVESVREGSLAARAGLEPGDELAAAEGHWLAGLSFEAAVDLVRRLQRERQQLRLAVRKGAALRHLASRRGLQVAAGLPCGECSAPAAARRPGQVAPPPPPPRRACSRAEEQQSDECSSKERQDRFGESSEEQTPQGSAKECPERHRQSAGRRSSGPARRPVERAAGGQQVSSGASLASAGRESAVEGTLQSAVEGTLQSALEGNSNCQTQSALEEASQAANWRHAAERRQPIRPPSSKLNSANDVNADGARRAPLGHRESALGCCSRLPGATVAPLEISRQRAELAGQTRPELASKTRAESGARDNMPKLDAPVASWAQPAPPGSGPSAGSGARSAAERPELKQSKQCAQLEARRQAPRVQSRKCQRAHSEAEEQEEEEEQQEEEEIRILAQKCRLHHHGSMHSLLVKSSELDLSKFVHEKLASQCSVAQRRQVCAAKQQAAGARALALRLRQTRMGEQQQQQQLASRKHSKTVVSAEVWPQTGNYLFQSSKRQVQQKQQQQQACAQMGPTLQRYVSMDNLSSLRQGRHWASVAQGERTIFGQLGLETGLLGTVRSQRLSVDRSHNFAKNFAQNFAPNEAQKCRNKPEARQVPHALLASRLADEIHRQAVLSSGGLAAGADWRLATGGQPASSLASQTSLRVYRRSNSVLGQRSIDDCLPQANGQLYASSASQCRGGACCAVQALHRRQAVAARLAEHCASSSGCCLCAGCSAAKGQSLGAKWGACGGGSGSGNGSGGSKKRPAPARPQQPARCGGLLRARSEDKLNLLGAPLEAADECLWEARPEGRPQAGCRTTGRLALLRAANANANASASAKQRHLIAQLVAEGGQCCANSSTMMMLMATSAAHLPAPRGLLVAPSAPNLCPVGPPKQQRFNYATATGMISSKSQQKHKQPLILQHSHSATACPAAMGQQCCAAGEPAAAPTCCAHLTLARIGQQAPPPGRLEGSCGGNCGGRGPAACCQRAGPKSSPTGCSNSADESSGYQSAGHDYCEGAAAEPAPLRSAHQPAGQPKRAPPPLPPTRRLSTFAPPPPGRPKSSGSPSPPSSSSYRTSGSSSCHSSLEPAPLSSPAPSPGARQRGAARARAPAGGPPPAKQPPPSRKLIPCPPPLPRERQEQSAGLLLARNQPGEPATLQVGVAAGEPQLQQTAAAQVGGSERANRLCFVDELKMLAERSAATMRLAEGAPAAEVAPGSRRGERSLEEEQAETNSATLIKVIQASRQLRQKKEAAEGAQCEQCCQKATSGCRQANGARDKQPRAHCCKTGSDKAKGEPPVAKSVKLRDEENNKRRQHGKYSLQTVLRSL